MSRDIPRYVQHYLIELQRHYDSIVFLNNDCKQLSDESRKWLDERNILNYPVKNEGYDFGMWAKYIRNLGVNDVTELALVNDSCVQFAPLDELINWSRNSRNDVCGLTDSHIFSYHLQSYFLIIKRNAIPEVASFISSGKITRDFLETVHTYEVGLSQLLINKKYSLGSLFSVQDTGCRRNLMTEPFDLIDDGLPMIKKKLIYGGPTHKIAAIVLSSQAKNFDLTLTLKNAQRMHQIDDQRMGELFNFHAISEADRNLKLGLRDRLMILKRRYLNPLLGIHTYGKFSLQYSKSK